MKKVNDTWIYSPSDLITFMDSPFASYMERWSKTDLDFAVEIDKDDPLNVLTQTSGDKHEKNYLESLKQAGRQVVEIKGLRDEDARLEATIQAMQDGAEIIFQAYLTSGRFAGYADFLFRVPGKSKFGDYHYEVWDTKLSKKLKPYFAVQLCCYAEMLEDIQGIRPAQIAVVLGNNDIKHLRADDYFAYYQALKASFLEFQDSWEPDALPDPADSKDYGRWQTYAEQILADRRHLSMVATITRNQIKRLEDAGINSIDTLANSDAERVTGIDKDVLARLKTQAAMQIASEGKDRPEFMVLPHDPEKQIGLTRLPPHSPNDVFFDIEGFPLIDGGLEYLWGNTYSDEAGERRFKDFWAHNHDEEKQAFMDFIDWVYARWRADPTMHIYHYASYEITAIRKLMGRYGGREHEVDTLLRNHVFVDLYKVVRHGILVGEPRYSIKNIEHLYRPKRETDVASGGESVVVYQAWREAPDGIDYKTSKILNDIRDYNIDDCDSTQELTAWCLTSGPMEQH